MPAFYLTFIAVLLTGLGARDQVLIARLSKRQGQRPAVLVVAVTVAIATAMAAGWAAQVIMPALSPRARTVFAAMALAFAGLELLVIRPGRLMQEPTMSLGALTVVLVVAQLLDAARFMIFAIAVASHVVVAPVTGGALAGGIMAAIGWWTPDLALNAQVPTARRVIGVVLLLAGVAMGLGILGIV